MRTATATARTAKVRTVRIGYEGTKQQEDTTYHLRPSSHPANSQRFCGPRPSEICYMSVGSTTKTTRLTHLWDPNPLHFVYGPFQYRHSLGIRFTSFLVASGYPLANQSLRLYFTIGMSVSFLNSANFTFVEFDERPPNGEVCFKQDLRGIAAGLVDEPFVATAAPGRMAAAVQIRRTGFLYAGLASSAATSSGTNARYVQSVIFYSQVRS